MAPNKVPLYFLSISFRTYMFYIFTFQQFGTGFPCTAREPHFRDHSWVRSARSPAKAREVHAKSGRLTPAGVAFSRHRCCRCCDGLVVCEPSFRFLFLRCCCYCHRFCSRKCRGFFRSLRGRVASSGGCRCCEVLSSFP